MMSENCVECGIHISDCICEVSESVIREESMVLMATMTKIHIIELLEEGLSDREVIIEISLFLERFISLQPECANDFCSKLKELEEKYER